MTNIGKETVHNKNDDSTFKVPKTYVWLGLLYNVDFFEHVVLFATSSKAKLKEYMEHYERLLKENAEQRPGLEPNEITVYKLTPEKIHDNPTAIDIYGYRDKANFEIIHSSVLYNREEGYKYEEYRANFDEHLRLLCGNSYSFDEDLDFMTSQESLIIIEEAISFPFCYGEQCS